MPNDPELWWKVKAGAVLAIKALALEGLTDRVYSQLELDDAAGYDPARDQVIDVTFPCVLLTSGGEVEEIGSGDTALHETSLPLRVWIADVNDRGRHKKERLYSIWRRSIWQLFDQRRPFETMPHVSSTVTPGVIFDPSAKQYDRVVGNILVRFKIFEER